MPDHLPKFKPGQAVTFTASTAIVGGNVVEVTGDRSVGVAGAASAKAVGTAGHDAAPGSQVAVHLPGPVDTMISAGAIAAGAKVEAAAAGRVQALTTGLQLGIALTAGTAGSVVQVLRV